MHPLPVFQPCSRTASTILVADEKTPSFLINRKNKTYKHQYSNIYFVRLRLLRKYIEQRAEKQWKHAAGPPVFIPRVLEIVKDQLCYIIGTVYMDMPLKPNVMDDIAREHGIPPLPPKFKFCSPEDNVMLEDESGRILLTGDRIHNARLVTGVIVGVLGMETMNGEFEVLDICYPGMAPQPQRVGVDIQNEETHMNISLQGQDSLKDTWIAVVSGLDVGSPSPPDAQLQMLVEYLTGEEGSMEDQTSASQISRLIIAGNSLVSPVSTESGENHYQEQKLRKYCQVDAPFSPHPIVSLTNHLLDIASAMPVHILPGYSDPSGVIMPQQPFPRAMMGKVASLDTFSCETNPTYLRVGYEPGTDEVPIERTVLVNSGQPVNDMFKYLPSPPNTRMSILESTLKWRHMAPTAPDTLWCHPYLGGDPFIITQTPDLYIVGNQKYFGTKLVYDVEEDRQQTRARCRIVMVPGFAKTGMVVLINLRSLEVKTVRFAIKGMVKGGEIVDSMDVEESVKGKEFPPSLASLDPSEEKSQHNVSSALY